MNAKITTIRVMPACRAIGGNKFLRTKQEALLFVNKKKQKNFDFFDVALFVPHRPEGEQKFFGSFFQKRTACLRL
jgi:hypothetical protein